MVSRLTDFVNLLLEGKCPERIRWILFGGRLIALRKKDGIIRPIAVGCYWRRLASKIANNRVMLTLAEYFTPLQLGVGVSGGCEEVVHAARRFLDNMQDSWVLVKLDFSNAFNSHSEEQFWTLLLPGCFICIAIVIQHTQHLGRFY